MPRESRQKSANAAAERATATGASALREKMSPANTRRFFVHWRGRPEATSAEASRSEATPAPGGGAPRRRGWRAAEGRGPAITPLGDPAGAAPAVGGRGARAAVAVGDGTCRPPGPPGPPPGWPAGPRSGPPPLPLPRGAEAVDDPAKALVEGHARFEPDRVADLAEVGHPAAQVLEPGLVRVVVGHGPDRRPAPHEHPHPLGEGADGDLVPGADVEDLPGRRRGEREPDRRPDGVLHVRSEERR